MNKRGKFWIALGLCAASTTAAANSVVIADCSLYRGTYFPDNIPEYTMNIVSSQYVKPEININFSRDNGNYLYDAALTRRSINGKTVSVLRIGLYLGSEQAHTETIIVPGKPLEAILQDANSNSALRCFNSSAPVLTQSENAF